MNDNPQAPERITTKHLWNSLKSILNLERGLPFSFWNFLIRPGKASQEYLFGNRKKFMDPIRFFVFAVAIGAYIMFHFIETSEFLPPEAFEEIDNGKEMLERISTLMGKYYNVLLFLNVPAYAIMSWILFNQKKWYFTEHLAINAFLYGTVTYTMPLLLLIPYEYRVDAMNVLSILISIYYIFAYKRIFEEDWAVTIGKGIIALTVASLFFFIFVGFIMGIVVASQMAAEGALG